MRELREDFVFSAGEQVFFREKQFQDVPRHCKECNAKHRNARGALKPASPARSAALPPQFPSCRTWVSRSCAVPVFSGAAAMLPRVPAVASQRAEDPRATPA
jgi:hypothetical protein